MPRWWQPHQQGPLRSRRQFCIAAQRRLAVLSRASTPEGSLHPFGQGNVAAWLNPCPAHYGPAFACSPFLYPLPCQVRLRFPLLPVGSRTTGLPRSAGGTDWWFRSRLFAAGTTAASEEFGAPEPDHVPCWPQPDSEAAVRRARQSRSSAASLAGSFMTAFNDASPELTMPPHPRPRPP